MIASSIPSTVDIISAIYICLIWMIIWLYSYSIDKKSRLKNSLPVDKRLVFCSGTLIALLSIFYVVLFFGIELRSNLFDISNFASMLLTATTRLLLMATTLAGAVLMVQSRRGLSMLTSKEVMFSLNKNQNQQASSGVYKSMHHPMYVGMTLITTSSLLIFPSILGVLLLVGIYFCLAMKIIIER